MKKVLVTGHKGFVGRHVYQALLDNGLNVVGMDVSAYRMVDMRREFLDLGGEFDLVVHAAACVDGRLGIENNSAFIGAYNMHLDAAYFTWILRAKPRHAVYLSSSAAYPVQFQCGTHSGMLKEGMIDLEYPLLPDQTYGMVKLAGERLAHEVNQVGGTRVHVVRPFSGYGTDQHVAYPFGAFLERVRRQEKPFHVWGDGRQVRDWIHIDDVVNGILAVVDADVIEPVNLCTGIGYSMGTVARMFIRAAGYKAHVVTETDKPTGVHHRVGDPAFMHEIYSPKVVLSEGIRRALE
jgi:nucleoside-diphosphate-sugar epimerase